MPQKNVQGMSKLENFGDNVSWKKIMFSKIVVRVKLKEF